MHRQTILINFEDLSWHMLACTESQLVVISLYTIYMMREYECQREEIIPVNPTHVSLDVRAR